MRNNRNWGRRFAFALLVTLASAAAAQDKYEPPRTADGKPNLSGTWTSFGRHNYDIEPHAARAALQMREGPIVPVPGKEVLALGAVGSVPGSLGIVDGGRIPYKPETLQQRDENRADWINRDPEIKCYLPGVPRANYMPYAFQILHNKDALFFAYEYAGAVRNVFLKDPGPSPVDSWMGQSWSSQVSPF